MKPTNTIALDAYKRLLAQQEEDDRRAKRKPRKPRHEESDIQRSCVVWFRSAYPEHALVLFAVPNGGGRSRVESAIMKGEGVTAGVSDLILLEARGGYGALCLEAKTERRSSRQSERQKAWQKAAERAGNKYEVFRSLEEFQVIVNNYMALPAGSAQVVVVKGSDLATETDGAKVIGVLKKEQGDWIDPRFHAPKY